MTIFSRLDGGVARTVVRVLTLGVTIVMAIAASFPTLAWTAGAVAALNALIDVVTHLTPVGDAPPA